MPLLILWALGGLLWVVFLRPSQPSATPADTAAQEQTVETTYLDTLDTSEFSAKQLAVLKVLKAEYAKHPTGFDSNVLTYTEGFEESWCADFISWVYNEAGEPFIRSDNNYWRIPGVETLKDYYQQYGEYYAVGDYTPQFGDVAFYFGETPDGSSTEHVAIVLGLVDGKLLTIGGNETDAGTVQIRDDELAEGVKGLTAFGASKLNS